MTERGPQRRPTTFKLDDPDVVLIDAIDRDSAALRGKVQIAAEIEPAPQLPVAIEQAIINPRKGFRWGTLFWSACGGLVSLAAGLAVTHLIEDLFARSQTLGAIGLALALLAGCALAVIIGREVYGMARLARIEQLHLRAAAVLLSDDPAAARGIVREMLTLEQKNPQLARARTMLAEHIDDIIDGADLVRLAERELLAPLDEEARALISQAAQRVSVVTAISPRALIDVLFVLVAAVRLVGQLARLYGGRPGALGMFRLMRQTVSHLAITGGIAVGDGLVQQVLGHGIAAKLSSRLGEGVVNGMLTARLGLAAIDLTRPLPFDALPRPALGDLVKDLVRGKRDKDE